MLPLREESCGVAGQRVALTLLFLSCTPRNQPVSLWPWSGLSTPLQLQPEQLAHV